MSHWGKGSLLSCPWASLEVLGRGLSLPKPAFCFRVSLVSECGFKRTPPLSQALAASKEDLVWPLPLFLLEPQFPPRQKGGWEGGGGCEEEPGQVGGWRAKC